MPFNRTFFGGGDDSWASTADTHTYFRNIKMFGSSTGSTMSGSVMTRQSEWTWVLLLAVVVFFCGLEFI